jgi:hypothetical protein
LAQQENDVADKQQAQYEADRTWLRPSSVETAHMEQAICWLACYLRLLPQLVRHRAMVTVSRLRSATIDRSSAKKRVPTHTTLRGFRFLSERRNKTGRSNYSDTGWPR